MRRDGAPRRGRHRPRVSPRPSAVRVPGVRVAREVAEEAAEAAPHVSSRLCAAPRRALPRCATRAVAVAVEAPRAWRVAARRTRSAACRPAQTPPSGELEEAREPLPVQVERQQPGDERRPVEEQGAPEPRLPVSPARILRPPEAVPIADRTSRAPPRARSRDGRRDRATRIGRASWRSAPSSSPSPVRRAPAETRAARCTATPPTAAGR